MSFIGDVFEAVGSFKSAEANRKAATNERVAAAFEADQLEQRATDTVAAGSFRSDRIQQRAAQIMSTQRAMAAANGGDTTDASVTAITDETIRKASVDSLLEMANAESAAIKDRLRAKKTRETGSRMSDIYRDRAVGDQLGGLASIANAAESWSSTYGSSKS